MKRSMAIPVAFLVLAFGLLSASTASAQEPLPALSNADIQALGGAQVGTPIEDLADFCRSEENPGDGCLTILETEAEGAAAPAPERKNAWDRALNRGKNWRLLINCTSNPCYGTQDADTINAWIGNSTQILARSGNDTVNGNANLDNVLGEGGDDEVFANEDADRLRGSGGADDLRGQGGWDRFANANGNYVYGLEGDDGWDDQYGGLGNDFLTGGAGQDELYGNEGDDIIDGTGDGEQDYIDGGAGNDDCAGGPGDTIVNC